MRSVHFSPRIQAISSFHELACETGASPLPLAPQPPIILKPQTRSKSAQPLRACYPWNEKTTVVIEGIIRDCARMHNAGLVDVFAPAHVSARVHVPVPVPAHVSVSVFVHVSVFFLLILIVLVM